MLYKRARWSSTQYAAGFVHSKILPQALQFSQNYPILELTGKPKSLKQLLKSLVFGIGSAIRAVQKAMPGLGVGLKDGVVLERYLLQSEISLNKRIDYLCPPHGVITDRHPTSQVTWRIMTSA